ncbi:small kinetochore-associated protein-like isoform X2 [Sceloporus undulatus]|uniref:small kinetochore-associated protein-like isoform X2 n=1 Tax=Sceloporus undulatus TaxID=8520 RepID=UPI001C4CABB2|nr:small kinetochore-associated protein-like isoform X2 [Sceloporus undulatus]
MESEKSRIPLYNFQQRKTVDPPMLVHSKNQGLNKVVDLNPLKDADFNFAVNIPVSLASKDPNQRPPKLGKNIVPQPPKKAMTAAARSPTNRYRREAELRNKNKLLESVKCELSIKLAGIQKEIKEMKEHNDSLEKENQKLKRFQESCMLVLETRNCDPGEKILEDEEENKKTQTEIMDLSEKLNADLQLFVEMAKEQKENFQNTQMKWKQIEEEEAHFLEQQQRSHKEIEDLLALLNQDNHSLDSS